MIAAHAVLSLEMADHRFDGRTSPELAFDLWRDAALLTCSEDPELAIGRRVVAAITGIGDGAIESIADERLHGGDDGRERVAIVRIYRTMRRRGWRTDRRATDAASLPRSP